MLAVTVARQADGMPMFITGCEAGLVLRWDAATGERIWPPLPGTHGSVRGLEVADLADGRQVLVGLDNRALYRWDPVTGQSPDPVPTTEWSWLAAAHAGRDGIPVALVNSVPDSDGTRTPSTGTGEGASSGGGSTSSPARGLASPRRAARGLR